MTVADESFVKEALLAKVPRWRDYFAAKLGFRNHWYPVKLSRDLDEGAVVKVQLCGEGLVLRRIEGKVHALKDRCLHRGVRFSDKVECYTKDTITCWYHGFTYKWDTGELCDILAAPGSKAIGRKKVRVYPVEEAKGLVFVFLGDEGIAPHPLSEDVPPTFLDADLEIHAAAYDVASNWRVGAENGFDGLHVYIHRTSPLLGETQRSLPVGHTATSGTVKLFEDEGAPKGVFDAFEDHDSVFEGRIGGSVVVRGTMRASEKPTRTTAASIWLPGCLRVDDFPDGGLTQFEWYAPVDENSHVYWICIGKRVDSRGAARNFEREFWNRWKPFGLEGFNNQDIEARISLQTFYQDDWAWLQETLIEADSPLIAWRELCHRHNRGIQKPEHLR